MLYLRKFNENKSELDIQYLEECFIEFLDNTKENKNNYTDNRIDEYGRTRAHKGDEYWHIQIFFPTGKFKEVNYIDTDYMKEVSEYNDLIGEVYKDINVGVDKVKIKYTEADFVFDFTYDDNPNYSDRYKSPTSIGIYIYKTKK